MTAPYVPMKRSILDRITQRLFPTLGLMSPEEGQAVGRQGLLQLGANLLQAGGPQAQQGGTLANIGRSIAGVDVNDLAKQAMAFQAYRQQQDANQRISTVAAANAPKDGESPTQTYERIARMVGQLAGTPGTEDLIGKLSNVLAQIRPQQEARARYIFKELEHPRGSGKYEIFRVNEDDPTDRISLGPGRTPLPFGSGATAGQREVLARMAGDALASLDEFGQTPPNLIEQALGSSLAQKVGGQALLGESRQLQNQASRQFAEAVLRFTTGAVAPAHELQEYLDLLTLRAGDKPALVTRKLSAQKTLLAALQALTRKGEVDPNEAASVLQAAAFSLTGGSESAPARPTGQTVTPFGSSTVPLRRP